MDNDPEVLHDGIRQIYVLDWLVKGVGGINLILARKRKKKYLQKLASLKIKS